jgi:hypothetical protein
MSAQHDQWEQHVEELTSRLVAIFRQHLDLIGATWENIGGVHEATTEALRQVITERGLRL